MKKQILQWNRGNIWLWEEVDAEALAPMYGYGVFLYSDEDQDIDHDNAPFEVFHVIEERSGLAFGHGFDKKSAVESADAQVVEHGKAEVDRLIAYSVEAYGESSSYKGGETGNE